MRKINAEEWKEFSDMFETLIQAKNSTPENKDGLSEYWKDLKKFYKSEEIRKGINNGIEAFEKLLIMSKTEIPFEIKYFVDSQRWFRAIIINELIVNTGTNKVMEIVNDMLKDPREFFSIEKLKSTLLEKTKFEHISELYPKFAKELTNLLKWWMDKIGIKHSLTLPFDIIEQDLEIYIAKFISEVNLQSMLENKFKKGGLL